MIGREEQHVEWNETTGRFYRDASERTGFYSRVVSLLRPFLSPNMHLCDAGCGFGYLSLHLAPYVKSVTAVDCHAQALSVLQENCQKARLTNILPVCENLDTLPSAQTFDAMVFCFFGAVEDICRIAEKRCTGRVFILKKNTTHHRFSVSGHSFGENPTARAEAFLKAAGVPYQKRLFSVEYGQPFTSTADALRFFSLYSRKEDLAGMSAASVEKRLIPTKDPRFPFYFPQKRTFSLLFWEQEEAPCPIFS